MRLRLSLILLAIPSLAMPVLAMPAAAPDGAAIFNRVCVVCHRLDSGTRAPLPAVLRQMTQESILRALETGKMQAQGSMLTEMERQAVAKYLGIPSAVAAVPASASCATPTPWVEKAPYWNGWGAGPDNARFQSSGAAGLTPKDVPRLKLKWAFGFPNSSSINSQPTPYGGQVFVGTEDGTVYSLNAQSGCLNWSFKALATVRTAPTVDSARRLLLFGDLNGNVYATDLANGRPVWQTRADPHPSAKITGSPVLVEGRLYVPVSSSEEGWAADPHYPCCTFRGAVVVIDARTGRQIWKSYIIPEEATQTGTTAAGVPVWGPSGGAVWSPPTVDTKRRAVYVGTGNSYTDPPSVYSDAVVAFDMDTGKYLWSQQLLPRDRWNIGCVVQEKDNCPPEPGPDYDFGAPPVLRSAGHGRDLLIIGQKSGIVHALDPDRKGEIVWQTRIGRGGPLGGIEWGGGADHDFAYYPVSDWRDSKPEEGGGIFALRIGTGEKVWHAAPQKPDCLSLPGCSPALIAPLTIIPGVVFSGSQDGHLRAYDARDGSLLWDVDCAIEFQTVNGVPGRGGTFTSIAPTVAGGMLFVDPGYGWRRGNTLLAFSVDGK